MSGRDEVRLLTPRRVWGLTARSGWDSAGGNLLAAVAHAARNAEIPLAAQLLDYSATGRLAHYPSRDDNATGYRLEAADMDDAAAAYAAEADRTDPRMSPIFSPDFTDLAPAIIAVAGFDPLRDDGAAYADKIDQAEDR